MIAESRAQQQHINPNIDRIFRRTSSSRDSSRLKPTARTLQFLQIGELASNPRSSKYNRIPHPTLLHLIVSLSSEEVGTAEKHFSEWCHDDVKAFLPDGPDGATRDEANGFTIFLSQGVIFVLHGAEGSMFVLKLP